MRDLPAPRPYPSRAPGTGLLAAILLLAASFPAAAQSGAAAVACVGSDRRILDSSNPVRRMISEDVAVVYRVGVGSVDREEMERSLIAELGDVEEVSCMWSDSGDSHVVIIQYTGAIRMDLTVDPDDPRFQAFSVGYGTSAQAAEQMATRVNARFSSHYDGSGYDVLVTESWAVSADAIAGGADADARSATGSGGADQQATPRSAPEVPDVPAVDPPTVVDPSETCAERVVDEGPCWLEPANRPGCYLQSPHEIFTDVERGRAATWSRPCAGGYAQGTGAIVWAGGDVRDEMGTHIDGIRQGQWTIRGNGSVSEGPYIDGEKNGRWLTCHYWGAGQSGFGAYIISYVDGQFNADDIEYTAHEDPDVSARCESLLRGHDE
ncbi:hypothetical protein [Candidatus Palauibacter irciniicola]|uniref:hypothetical protein n=1 Tax=Candidatus Palauibacter irciniicola TaxID=3056733 RepID=UPI003B01FFB0